jgi:hypothetical protein
VKQEHDWEGRSIYLLQQEPTGIEMEGENWTYILSPFIFVRQVILAVKYL